jgi:hypothetical protein
MSDDPQNQNSNANNSQPEFMSRHEERMQRREERWAARGTGGAWVGGAILIVLGLVFLMQNLGVLALNNWWALFILIPAIGSFTAAWRTYQNAGGRLTAASRGSLIGGLVLTMIAAVFLFNLNWAWFGPVLIILAGIGLLLNATLQS